jgi:dihydroorotate dehydrogenase
MVYSTLYKHGLSKLPDKLLENSGGHFYSLYSKLFSVKTNSSIFIPKLNTHITYPWGLASGWADDLQKIFAIKALGAGIIFGKTITLNPRKGNPYPRLVRDPKKAWLINSMGLPNSGLHKWIFWLRKYEKLPEGCYLSVKGDSINEWKVLINSLSRYTDLIELNVSCPNVSKGILDKSKTQKLIESILSSANKTNLTIKFSSEYSSTQIIELLKTVTHSDSKIVGVSLFNTYPITHQHLGNPEKKGGLSGPLLYKKLFETVDEIRNHYSYNDLLIFATGGINSVDKVKLLWEKFRAFPLIMTSFITEGPNIFRNFHANYNKGQF